MARRKVTRGAPPQLARSAARERPAVVATASAGSAGVETAVAAVSTRASASRSDSGRESEDGPNFLSLYFREMSELDVMDPVQEMESATRICRLREEYWKCILCNVAFASSIVPVIEQKVDPEATAAMAQLKQELENQGLKELAELLDKQQTPDEEIAKLLESQTANQSPTSSNTSKSPQWTPTANQTNYTRATMVVQALRDRIQEAILMEISADRDAAVPAEYENAVDGYFRTIAGESEPNSMESNE